MVELVAHYWKAKPEILLWWPDTRYGSMLKIATRHHMPSRLTARLLQAGGLEDGEILRLCPAYHMTQLLPNKADNCRDLSAMAWEAWEAWVDSLTSPTSPHSYEPDVLYSKVGITRAYLEAKNSQYSVA